MIYDSLIFKWKVLNKLLAASLRLSRRTEQKSEEGYDIPAGDPVQPASLQWYRSEHAELHHCEPVNTVQLYQRLNSVPRDAVPPSTCPSVSATTAPQWALSNNPPQYTDQSINQIYIEQE